MLREILLVEDNPADARLTMIALEECRISNSIVHVKDGEEALDYIFCRGAFANRNKKDLPMLVLLDLKMPKVDGIEVVKNIKADELTKSIPVIIFTSSQQDQDVHQCYVLGANSYVVKPLDFDQFSKAVNNIGSYWTFLNHVA
jgi:two-component system response regulator